MHKAPPEGRTFPPKLLVPERARPHLVVCVLVAPVLPALWGASLLTCYLQPTPWTPPRRQGRGGGCPQPRRSAATSGRTYGFLGIHPQACQVVAKEGDLVFGALRQGEVGAAGPWLQTHKAAGDKPSAQLNGPWLDGEWHGSLVAQVNHVGDVWDHKQKTGAKKGSAAPPWNGEDEHKNLLQLGTVGNTFYY